jgi:large subunit ribosomal protein L4
VALLKKYNFSGKEIGTETIEDNILEVTANSQMIKDYIVAMHANARQWSANTKGRKEINCTGAKPHAQKGTGRARQGTYAAPQFRGGGIALGPKPKFDQHVKINKKEKRKAISSLLAEKVKADKACILELKDDEASKTKQVDSFLQALNIKGTRTLVIAKHKEYQNLKRCMQNIQRVEFADVICMNGYDIALCKNVIILSSVLEEVKDVLNKGKKK